MNNVEKMGQAVARPVANEIVHYAKQSADFHKAHFTIDRLVDGNCDYIRPPPPDFKGLWEQNVKLGIYGAGEKKNNPLAQQGIRIGASPIFSLLSFKQLENGFEYTFENDVRLFVGTRGTKEIYYHLVYPGEGIDVTRAVNPAICKFYKPIGPFGNGATLEIDAVEKIYKEQQMK